MSGFENRGATLEDAARLPGGEVPKVPSVAGDRDDSNGSDDTFEQRAVGSDELVADLARGFGIPVVHGWEDIGGGWTTNLRLDVDGRPLVARIHPIRTTTARLLAIQAARIALAEAGIPTVRPLAAPDGTTLVELSDGRHAELEPFVTWEDRMNSAPLLRLGHSLLARVHDTLRAVELPEAADWVPDANHIPSEEALAATRQGARRVRGWRHPALAVFADAVVDHVETVSALESPLREDQLVQVVHGDFWDDNVLFSGGRPTALLDFGFMGRRPRIDDLALTAYFFLLEPGKGIPGSEARDDIRSFVDAYDQAATIPLSAAERAALPLAIARQPAWSVGGWVVRLDDAAARAHALAAAREFGVARSVLANLSSWQRALA